MKKLLLLSFCVMVLSGCDFSTNPGSETNTVHNHTPKDATQENITQATCLTEGSYDSVVRCEECDEVISSEHIILPPTGHDWNEPIYEWNEDFTFCLAKRICKNDSSHIEEENGKSTSLTIKMVSAVEDGLERYSVDFLNPAFSSQYLDVKVDHNLLINKLKFELVNNSYYKVSCKNIWIEGYVDIPSEYNGYPVKIVDDFALCEKITEVRIPKSVETINNFSCCSSLENLIIEEGLVTIQDQAFYECTSLKSVRLPDTLRHIGRGAFYHSAVTSLNLNKNLTFTETECPYGSPFEGANFLTLYCELDKQPATWKDFWAEERPVIWGTTNILVYEDFQYQINDSGIVVTGIRDAKTEVLNIPNDVNGVRINSIMDGAFHNNDVLKNIDFAEGIVKIGTKAFYWCKNIETVHLPDSIIDLGAFAFGACPKLKQVNLPKNLEVLKDSAFCQTGIEYLEIPENLKIIEEGAFCGSKLVYVFIPATVITIGEDAFAGCKNLSVYTSLDNKPDGWNDYWIVGYSTTHYNNTVYWGTKATFIYENVIYSFCVKQNKMILSYNLNKVTEEVRIARVVGGVEVSEIENGAFINCHNLKSVFVPSNIRWADNDVFKGCELLTIYCESSWLPGLDWNPDSRPVIYNYNEND